MCTYFDNPTLADLSNSDSHFSDLQITEVIRWCKDNYLDFNVDKTREMVGALKNMGDVSELSIDCQMS